jgi:Leucine-rich repeat (LRR) protein
MQCHYASSGSYFTYVVFLVDFFLFFFLLALFWPCMHTRFRKKKYLSSGCVAHILLPFLFVFFLFWSASNNLVGSIPPEIRHLSQLTFLDLHNNTLTGSLPTDLQTLTHLNYLNLNVNQITGTIPHWIGDSLIALQALGLSDNLLQGNIPLSLGTGLKQYLKSLSLDNNMLTGDIAPLQRLRYLEYLYLNDNDLMGRLDHGLLADMNFLVEVDLSGNQISNRVPNYLFTLQKLKILDLSNNQLTGSLVPKDDSSHASPLEFLSLRNNSLVGSIPEELIPNLFKLYHLDLSFNELTGDCPDVIGDELTHLAYFFMGDNALNVTGGTIPDHLQSLTNLRELSMGNLSLQGSIPIWIENFEHLRLLDLSNNHLTGSLDLDFTKLKHLRYLILHDNVLTGSLPSSMSTLQEMLVMSLHHNNITDDDTSTTAALICSSATELALMTVDCEEITCPCCDTCCDKDDDDVCYEGVIWETLQHLDGKWEEHFARSDYSFNPHVTLTGAFFEGELACGDHCQ